jgi:hypothetical protein
LCIPLTNLGLPDHLLKLLETANWGKEEPSSRRRGQSRITIGSLFDKDNSTYEVISFDDNQVRAIPFFGNSDQPIHFPNTAEVEAAIALKVGVEDSSAESSAESSVESSVDLD